MSNQVIQFKARPAKAATPKRWIGSIEAERERCLAVCLHPVAGGHWGDMARTLLRETALDADSIIQSIQKSRAEVQTELAVELAAGTL